jgi:type IV pilus assembly protein PilO
MNIREQLSWRNPKFRNALLIILVGLGAFLFWYNQFYQPVISKINSLKTVQKQKQDELNTILALKPQLNILKAELNNAQMKLDSLKSIFPDQKEVPKLIRELTAVAGASGIYTTKFNPMPDVEKDYYLENRYSIGVTGGYHQLGVFFSFLANFPLIINLTEVVITANSDLENSRGDYEDQGLALPSITASFALTTFSSKR